jgi:uncharacterized protein YbaR (Trm112 family)
MRFNFDAVKDILVCPKSHAELVFDGETLVSTDPHTRLEYKVLDGIPIMLVEDAAELSGAEWAAVMRRHDRDPQTGRRLGGAANSSGE